MRTSFSESEGWPRPLRAPQHAAAPFTLSAHARQHMHRALRLFVTAGTWAAGLCLVIGSIVLVVSAASSNRDDPLAATSAAGLTAGRAGPAAAHDRVVAAFAGYGDRSSRSFRVGKNAAWQLQWSYTCPVRLRAGLLVVEVAGARAVGATISQSGAGGHGAQSISPDGQTHRLVVISSCSWTMKVTQKG
jgi:hypothetical protein